MASLNTLRTKFGIVLSIIIALALLAFILSLKTEMGFSGNDPRVGVIDGKKINYSEYYDQYEQIKQQKRDQVVDKLRKKYGFASVVRASSLLPGATAIARSRLVGGHNGGNAYE